MSKKEQQEISRRQFLRCLGFGSALVAVGPLSTMAAATAKPDETSPTASGKMTYRIQNGSGEAVSLLGFGMMRVPREQEEVNRLVDYALDHGVNYFDTAPVYGRGTNEEVTGRALSRHPRERYFVATKLSNQNPELWDFGKSKEMYENSFRQLQVDYIDYYLLHAIGGGGVDNLKKRFLDNGVLDFLLKEREAGRIRHLGFSYHGDVAAFDYLLQHHDQYHWDFVQIQMNYLDWRHAGRRGRRGGDADAEYLYGQLERLGIQCVVMEPLRGGALANVNEDIRSQLAAANASDSPARWAFCWVGSHPNVLTALSGMNRMEHLEENIQTFSPLQPCSPAEEELLARIADQMSGFPTIGCTTCQYCMPCPYGVDIPANFAFYNEAVAQGMLPLPPSTAADYDEKRRAYTEAYRKAIPEVQRASACQDCGQCLPKCPQQIRIPNQLSRLVELTRKRRS